MSEPDQREEALFEAVLQLPSEQRAGYLDQACADDPALRRRVEALLGALERAGGFLKQPAVTVRADARITEKAGDRIERYKLLQEIGEGGCGVVYMAEQEEPVRRRVALKVIKLGMDTKQVVARFEAERQALALMDHPNIAKVLDAGVTETGRPYFVMELVRGVPLTEYCDKNDLSTQQRLELFIPICKAIQHAHQKGVIHRDIKPSNILVTLHDGVPVPKVIDFGIAKAIDQPLTEKTLFTRFEQFLGTPAYMSPEQAEMSGLDIDTRSDIYALGVLLYELLTGKPPFDSKELAKLGLDEMRRTICQQDPPKPSTRLSAMAADELTTTANHRQTESPKLVHAVRGDLDWIVMKCLEKDRTRRYETASGLAADVLRHLNNEPVVARPPTGLYRLQKSVRRNKGAFAAATVIAVVLLIGVVVSTWQAIRATRAVREQVRLRQQDEIDEKKARTEAAQNRQTAQFLKDMLKGVGPSVALGRDTTMLREIVDKTAERIGADLKDQPEVEIELRLTLAEVYWDLQLPEKTEVMAREALRLARARFGEENLDVADALGWVGVALHPYPARIDEAEVVIRQAIAMQRKLRGEGSVQEADSLCNLGDLLRFRAHLSKSGEFYSRLAEAETACRECLAIRRKRLGNDSRKVAWALDRLNVVLENEGKLAEAEGAIREALAIIQRTNGGKDDPVSCGLYERLSRTLITFGSTNRLPEAETDCRKALEIEQHLYGQGRSWEVIPQFTLAEALELQGKLDDAESHYRTALAIARTTPVAQNLGLPHYLAGLAGVLRKQGKLAEARPLAEEAVTICGQFPDEMFIGTLDMAFRVLGDVLRDLGDANALKKLELTRQQVYARRKPVPIPEPPPQRALP